MDDKIESETESDDVDENKETTTSKKRKRDGNQIDTEITLRKVEENVSRS